MYFAVGCDETVHKWPSKYVICIYCIYIRYLHDYLHVYIVLFQCDGVSGINVVLYCSTSISCVHDPCRQLLASSAGTPIALGSEKDRSRLENPQMYGKTYGKTYIYILHVFYICSACFSPLVVPNLLLYIVMRGWLVARLLSCSSSKSTTASCLCGVPLLDIRRIDIGRRSTLFPCASEAGDHHPRVVIQD